MHIKDIRLLYEYNYWSNKKFLTASVSITQKQFIKPTALPAGYGSSPCNLDCAVFLNEYRL